MTSKSSITPEVLDQLLANYERPEDLIGEAGLFKQLKKALIERALGAELTEHLGYEKAIRPAAAAATVATAPVRRRSWPRMARSRLLSRAIAPAASSRS